MKSSKIKKRILVVDNDKTTVGTMCRQISTGKYTPVGVHGAQEAWEIINQNNIDAILIDIMMPDIDGITFAEQLLKKNTTKNTPVILFSALSINSKGFEHSERINQLSNVKATLEKPFTADKLIKTIDKSINQK